MASVVASDPVPGGVELVIVDDGSQDESLDRARALTEAAPIPARVVAKHRNTGLADARNVGLQLARGALALTLDADNWIHPSCLARLAEALDDGEVAAAYPILRRFHDGSGAPAGLLLEVRVEPPRPRAGPYIDALALFRRDALIGPRRLRHRPRRPWLVRLGGDELWLAAGRERRGVRHVPAVLACYRVHGQSMLGRTNRSTDAIARHLASRFNALAAQHPGQESYFGFPVTGAAARLPPSQPRRTRPASRRAVVISTARCARSARRGAGGSPPRCVSSTANSASPHAAAGDAMTAPPDGLVGADSRDVPAASGEVRAFLVVRDEVNRLPHLLAHHRRLGITRFFVVDNGSTDGSREFAQAQPDVHLFTTTTSYQAANLGIDWIVALLDRLQRRRLVPAGRRR